MLKGFTGYVIVFCLAFASGPVLRAQSESPLIAYRQGTKWGYADTLGNVKIKPVYDQVRMPGTTTAFIPVSMGGKWGVVSAQGKRIVPVKYEFIYPNSGYIYVTNEHDDRGLYDRNGNEVFPAVNDDIGFINHRLIIVHGPGEKSAGVALMSKKQRLVKGILPQRFERIHHFDHDSTIHAFTENEHLTYKVTTRSTLTLLETAAYDSDEIVEMVAMDNGDYNRRMITKYLSFSVDTVRQGNDTKFTLGFTEGAGRTGKKPEIIMAGCDDIRIVAYPNGFKNWHTTADTRNEFKEWALVKKDGKYGAYHFTGNGLPCQYDSIAPVILFLDSDTFLYKARKGRSWGMITDNGTPEVDFLYDDILVNDGHYFGTNHVSYFNKSKGIAVKKNGRFNILTAAGQLLNAAGFDHVTEGSYSLEITDKGKKGVFIEGISFPPAFPHHLKLGRMVSVNGFRVLEIRDENEALLGYGDRNGRLYFSL